MDLYGRRVIEHGRYHRQPTEGADQRPKRPQHVPNILMLCFSIPQIPRHRRRELVQRRRRYNPVQVAVDVDIPRPTPFKDTHSSRPPENQYTSKGNPTKNGREASYKAKNENPNLLSLRVSFSETARDICTAASCKLQASRDGDISVPSQFQFTHSTLTTHRPTHKASQSRTLHSPGTKYVAQSLTRAALPR